MPPLLSVPCAAGGTAYPTIAWALWDHYGDLDVLVDHFAAIKAWVENVKAGWANTGLKNIWYEYGDWVPPPPYGQTDGHLISSFPFMRDVLTVAKMAHLLNDTGTEQAYLALYQQLAQEFHSTFYSSADVGYSNGMQTANALALALPGVVPDNLTDSVVAALVKDVQDKGHLTTGIVGVAQLFPVLSAHKQHDLALMLAQSITYPSYGWMFSNEIENATTLSEQLTLSARHSTRPACLPCDAADTDPPLSPPPPLSLSSSGGSCGTVLARARA